MELPIGISGGGTGDTTIEASPIFASGRFTGKVEIGGLANVHEGVIPSLEVTTSNRVDRLSGLSFFNNNAEGPIFVLAKSRGALAGILVFPEGGDNLGRFDFEGANPSVPRFDVGARINATAISEWTATNRESSLEFLVVAAGVNNLVVALTIQSDSGLKLGSYINMSEMATRPPIPAANSGQLFMEDNGSGKTRLVVRWPSGGSLQIAVES